MSGTEIRALSYSGRSSVCTRLKNFDRAIASREAACIDFRIECLATIASVILRCQSRGIGR